MQDIQQSFLEQQQEPTQINLIKTCKCLTPSLWIFGNFYISFQSFSMFDSFWDSPIGYNFMVIAIFSLFVAVITISNGLHGCLGLNTATDARKIQKNLQIVFTFLYAAGLTILLVKYFFEIATYEDEEKIQKYADDCFWYVIQFIFVYLTLSLSAVCLFCRE